MGFFSLDSLKSEAPATGLAKCGACGLSKGCLSPKMKPTGKGRRKILFIGEAPGEQEDRQGVQLIGEAGQCLRRMLKSIKVDLDDCWKTNAAICRPPKNEIEDLHIESCRPNVRAAIAELKPNVIVLLGMSAVKSVVGSEWGGTLDTMGKWLGWRIPSPAFGAWLCPTYHPSYVIRQKEDATLVRMVMEHLQAAVALEDAKVVGWSPEQLSREVEVIPSIDKGIQRMKGLVGCQGICAFDYETTGLKPENDEQRIYSVSFSLGGKDTFACRVDRRSYEVLSEVLRNPDLHMVASNLKFEERWTRCKLRHGVASWHWDTMLAAHTLDNRAGITGLKFQSYVNFGVGDYSTSIAPYLQADTPNGQNQIKDAPVEDLLQYNGMDSLLEYRLMEKQKELMYGTR